jgi:acetylglutamate kinase
LESRRQHPARTPRLKQKANSAAAALSLPNIAQLIEDGKITIGMLRPLGCVATAADEDCNYAMLVRRRGESLPQLLARLDQAIDKALTLGIFTDEINR